MNETYEPNPIRLRADELQEACGFAERKHQHAEILDLALAQVLREWLWRDFMTAFSTDSARAILPLIFASRRIETLEQKGEEQITVEESQETARKLFGDLPDFPLESSGDLSGSPAEHPLQ